MKMTTMSIDCLDRIVSVPWDDPLRRVNETLHLAAESRHVTILGFRLVRVMGVNKDKALLTDGYKYQMVTLVGVPEGCLEVKDEQPA
jgi:hypothetical protein